VEGFAVCSASGSLIGRFASEVANSAIIARAGSNVQYAQVL
jgi:ribosomal protein L13